MCLVVIVHEWKTHLVWFIRFSSTAVWNKLLILQTNFMPNYLPLRTEV